MMDFMDQIPRIVETVKALRDTLITNIILVGEKAAPTFQERERAGVFLDRMAQFDVDECTSDSFQNPVGIIRGSSPDTDPILIVAHLDTTVEQKTDLGYTVKQDAIIGPGIADNSVGVGALLTLPFILKRLGIQFESDIILAGVKQSIGRGNLRGIRHLLKNWPTPIRGALCVEGVELGRLNYYSEGMIRAEIDCISAVPGESDPDAQPNAILVVNEIINSILELRLPQKPKTRIVIGRMTGGTNHGKNAESAHVGLEIRSDADNIVKELYRDVEDIVEAEGRFHKVQLNLKTVSNLSPAKLRFNHPLVKCANRVMRALELEPIVVSSESELSILLSYHIPSITLGITRSHPSETLSGVRIEPMFKGMAQLVGVLMAIDRGACDEQ